MEIKKIDNAKYAAATLTTAAVAGALSAAVGYNQSAIDKNGNVKDVFVSQVAESLQEQTTADIKKTNKIIGEMPISKSFEELAQTVGPDATPKQIAAAIKEENKRIRTGLKKVLTDNFDTFAITRKEGQTVQKAVDNYMRGKSTSTIWQQIAEQLETQNRMLANADNKAAAKEYIKLTFDTKTKDFKKATSEIPQTAIDFIKKEFKQVKMNNAVKWAGIASGFVTGIGAIVWVFNALTAKKQ